MSGPLKSLAKIFLPPMVAGGKKEAGPMSFSAKEIDKLERAGKIILEAEDALPVLRSIAWPDELAEGFFSFGESIPPEPVYPVIEETPTREKTAAARALIDGDTPVHDWLLRLCDMADETAALLATLGTPDFYRHSLSLYGGPETPVADGEASALDLAQRLDRVLSEYRPSAVKNDGPVRISAETLKARLEAALPEHFGEESPAVLVSDTLSAKAAAGRTRIRLRADAAFSDLDFDQLLQHEALVHIATAKNGAAQTRFPILGESHPGNAKTQEGLAVFAEFIAGALDPRRFKRLAERVIAIDMAANGADFMELYRFFRERNAADEPFEAFESARRVVRGGVVSGGAPFTKDSVYLGGLLEVHNYLRAAVRTGETRFIRLLFVGKMDLIDLDAIDMLQAEGLIEAPRFIPPWAADLRFLLSYLAYSTFLNEIDMKRVTARFEPLFSDETGLLV